MDIQIRISVPDDVCQIREVQRITWLCTYPNDKYMISKKDIAEVFQADLTPIGKEKMEERKKRYENLNTCIWVAENDHKIIGFCAAQKEINKNRIGAIYLIPDYQGKGVGKLLIKQALAWLGKEKNIYVNVVQYNTQAINFYKKVGFVETGKNGTFDTVATLPNGKKLPEIELVIKIAGRN